jgi:hypothetical protein
MIKKEEIPIIDGKPFYCCFVRKPKLERQQRIKFKVGTEGKKIKPPGFIPVMKVKV